MRPPSWAPSRLTVVVSCRGCGRAGFVGLVGRVVFASARRAALVACLRRVCALDARRGAVSRRMALALTASARPTIGVFMS